jgi:hypothetical protein
MLPIVRRFLVCSAILLIARAIPAEAGGGTQQRNGVPQQAGDTLFSRPHDIFPEELMKQMPRPGSGRMPFSTGAAPSSLYPNVNVSVDTFPQNEPSVRISRKHPNRVIAAWRDFSTGVNPAIRRVGYSLSTDGGSTWSPSALLPIVDPVHLRASDPAVGVDTAGNFYIATISINNTNNDGKILVFRSTNEGETFDSADIAPSSPGTAFDDKEYIVSDLNPASPFANTLYISWTRFGTPGGIQLTRSTDHGHTWSPMVQVSDGTGVQGSDPAIGPNGEVYVVWAGAGVMFDKSTDGGTTFGVDSTISPVSSLHGFPSIAVDQSGGTRNGTIYVTWSDARNGDDDVFLSSSTNGGTSWSPPVRVNDDPIHNNRLQYWPWLAVDNLGQVALVYYDTRNTVDNTIFEAYLATSLDGGQTFTNTLLSSQPSPQNTPNSDVRFGDYIGIDAWDSRIVPVWTDERAGGYNMDIYTAVIRLPQPASVPVSVSPGWNILSLPTTGGNPLTRNNFPTAGSPAFSYEGSYLLSDTLRNGRGYWMRFADHQMVKITGDSLSYLSISAFSQWNLIGSISSPVPVSTIGSDPPGVITSRYFGFSSGYHVIDTLYPGSGGWVKTSAPAQLILSQPLAKQAIATGSRHELDPLSRLTLTDASGYNQTLYFGMTGSAVDPRKFEMPPVAPGDVFGARFASQRMVELSSTGESRHFPIMLSGVTYPLVLSWRARDESASLNLDGRELPLRGEGTARLLRPIEKLALALSPPALSVVPGETRLEQNYPNPFNPSTTIPFVINQSSFVTLKVYDVLGREIATLVHEPKLPGRYSVEWNPAGAPTGLYYYRLTAGTFTQSKTTALVR